MTAMAETAVRAETAAMPATTGMAETAGGGRGGREGRATGRAEAAGRAEMLCVAQKIIIIRVTILPQCPHVHGTDWYVGYYNPHTYQHCANKNIISVFAFSVKALIIKFIRREKCNHLLCTFLCTNYLYYNIINNY